MKEDIPLLERFTKGDTKAVLYFNLTDRNGSAISTSGKTVTLEGRKRGAAAAFAPIACTMTDDPSGEGEADVASELCDDAGEYRVQIRIDEGGSLYYRSDPGKIVVGGAAADGEA